MKTLVLPDIHNRWQQAQKILNAIEFDQVIMLGDYFDDFNDGPEEVRRMAEWLRDVVIPDKRITLLIGNHDLAYIFSYNEHTRCPGYSDAKKTTILSVVSYNTFLERFKFFHVADGFLFSHAGVSNRVWKDIQMVEPDDVQLLDILPKWINRSIDGLKTLHHAPMFEAGWSRGGPQQYGGIVWADWNDEFGPVKGVNQIVGHTPHTVPEVKIQFSDGMVKRLNAYEWAWSGDDLLKKQVTSLNYNLDTHLHHFAVIEDGKVSLWDADLMIPMKRGQVITTPNGLPFSSENQLFQPDYGVFRV